MIRKLNIALTACTAVLLAAGLVPAETASAEQLAAKKKNSGLLVPAIQKARERAAKGNNSGTGKLNAGTTTKGAKDNKGEIEILSHGWGNTSPAKRPRTAP